MKYLLSLSLMVLFLTVGSTTTYAQSNPDNCPPACKKICEMICGKSSVAKTTALAGETAKCNKVKPSCAAASKTASTQEEPATDFVQALLVSQKVEPASKADAPKCTAADKKKACCSRKQ